MKTFNQFKEDCQTALYNQYMTELSLGPAGRLVPYVGAGFAANDAMERAKEGDWEGALYSGLQAGANLLLPPGVGSAVDVGLIGLQQLRDAQRKKGLFAKGEVFGEKPQAGKPTPTQPTQVKPQQSQAGQPTPTQPTQVKPQQPQPVNKEIVSKSTGAGGKTSTNTAYQSKLGGAKATTTYGKGGEQMIRANLGNQGIDKVAAGQAAANKAYAAKLGGVQGTVTYDAKGNKKFEALKPKS